MMTFISENKKNLSNEHHIEVEFYIPNGEGDYTERVDWIDAHHLMKVITKDRSNRLLEAAKAAQKQAESDYKAKLLEEHRKTFAPENVELMKQVEHLNGKVNELIGGTIKLEKSLDTWKKFAITLPVIFFVLGLAIPLAVVQQEARGPDNSHALQQNIQ